MVNKNARKPFLRLSGDAWLALGLFLILIVVILAGVTVQQIGQRQNPPLSTFSSDPDGARALSLWIEELGYSTANPVISNFRLSTDTAVMFMLEPWEGISEVEWRVIDRWVSDGGTVVLAGRLRGTAVAAEHYNFNLVRFPAEEVLGPAVNQSPFFDSPPLLEPLARTPRYYWTTSRSNYITHLAVNGRPVLVSFDRGDGRVFLSATEIPFTNAGLKEQGNPVFVLNILSGATRSGRIWFNEWHHGRRLQAREIVGPGSWLRYTASGRALLYAGAVIFLVLLLRGRRFGRPLTDNTLLARRAPLAHINAIANLNRRAGHRTAVLGKYRLWLKRGLGQRYRLNPTLPDDEFVTQLTAYNPNLDEPALRHLLARLKKRRISESELVELAAEVANWLNEHRSFV